MMGSFAHRMTQDKKAGYGCGMQSPPSAFHKAERTWINLILVE